MNKKILSIILSVTTILTLSGCSKKDIDNYINKIFHKNNSTSFVTGTNPTYESTTEYTTMESTTETTTEQTTTKEETTTSYYDTFTDSSKNVYTTTSLKLREEPTKNSDVLDIIDEYNKCQLIKENKDWCYVSYNGMEGYVIKDYVKELGDTFVEVDISNQKLYLYKDEDLILESNVVTGKKNVFDTRLGCHPIRNKVNGTYLEGGTGNDHYKVWVDFWMPFDGGMGIHDATWRNNFDSDAYINGSHGCVNMKYDDAKEVYKNVSVGTKVLVHK